MSSRSASTSEPNEPSGAQSSGPKPSGPKPSGPRPSGPGRVVVVATPIGNLGDLSPRATEALASSDYVYCEDTRRTLKLLSYAGISGPRLVSHHRHNEAATTPAAVARAKGGASIAIVTDAGTPLVSDPGARLVRAALAEGIPVETVPGPSAALAALVVSGLATDRFAFEGFLPRSGRQRRERLAAVAGETDRAVVIFESPHRLQRALDDLLGVCGPDRPIAVCRELTKMHEEIWRTTTGEAAERARGVKPRGEYVLVLGPPATPPRPPPAPGGRADPNGRGPAGVPGLIWHDGPDLSGPPG
jgi:16S rRNA (cytidine1402-2'-O)-methyltransferase